MKRTELSTVMIVTIVVCLLLAAAMVLTACSGGEKVGPSEVQQGTTITLPSGVVFHVSANRSEKLFRFAWENVPYTELRLYNSRQDDEILVSKGMSYVDLSFSGTSEYDLEYKEGEAWKVLQPIVFYRLDDIDSSAVVASYAQDGQTTLTWEQTDFAANPTFEVLIRHDGEESLASVTGSSITRALTEGDLYRMCFRETAAIEEESGKLKVPYSYWSDPIDVCRLASVGEIKYEELKENDAEKIYIERVKNALGYTVSAYYVDPAHPVVTVIPTEAPYGFNQVKLDFSEISQMTASFNLRISPIGTKNKVELAGNSVGRLYIEPEFPSEQKVTMNDPVTKLGVNGDSVTWANLSGNVSFYVKGTRRQDLGGTETPWMTVVYPTDSEMIVFDDPNYLIASTVVSMDVKPIYYTSNTFSRWASVNNLSVLGAPSGFGIEEMQESILLSWNETYKQYTLRQCKDDVYTWTDVTGSSRSISSDLTPGTYTFAIAPYDTTLEYIVVEGDKEESRKGCLAFYSEERKVIKLPKPSYSISHNAPGNGFSDRDSITIKITSEDTYEYQCKMSGNEVAIDDQGVITLMNSNSLLSGKFTLSLRTKNDPMLREDCILLQSEEVRIDITKKDPFYPTVNNLVVNNTDIRWSLTSGSSVNFYSCVFMNDTTDSPAQYVKFLCTSNAYEYDAFTEAGKLRPGGYAFRIAYSQGYSGGFVDGDLAEEDAMQNPTIASAYYLDGESAKITFYKNATPLFKSINGKNLAVEAGAKNEDGNYVFYVGSEIMESTPTGAVYLPAYERYFQPGANAISVVRKRESGGSWTSPDNITYNTVLASDPFTYTVRMLETPTISISESTLRIASAIPDAVKYSVFAKKGLVNHLVSDIENGALTLYLNAGDMLADPGEYALTVSAIADEAANERSVTLDSPLSKTVFVTRFGKPGIAYRDQMLLPDWSYGTPKKFDFYFYSALDPSAPNTVSDYIYHLSGETYDDTKIDLRLSALQSRLGLTDTVMMPGEYKARIRAIGNGVDTLDSKVSEYITFRKQVKPTLTFEKVIPDGSYSPIYRVKVSFGNDVSEEIITSTYSFRQNDEDYDASGAIVDMLSYYTIRYHELEACKSHTFYAYLNNDNAKRFLPSDVITIDYYKLCAPTYTEFRMAADFSAVSWRTIDPKGHLDYYGDYYYTNTIAATVTTGFGASMDESVYHSLASGKTGTVSVISVGNAEQNTVDSEPTAHDYSRAAMPVLTFESRLGDATDSSVIKWDTYGTDAVYSFAFTCDGNDYAAMTALIVGREATFPKSLSSGVHAFALKECGDHSAFRLPSDYSTPISVTKLEKVGGESGAFGKDPENLSWDSISGATEYVVTSADVFAKKVITTSYPWKTELITAGEYRLRVIARSTSHELNYIDADASDVVVVVKLAVPEVTLGDTLKWAAVDEATQYDVTVQGGAANTISERSFDLYTVISEAGDYTVTLRSMAVSTPTRHFLISEPKTVSVTKLAAPNVYIDTNKRSTVAWNSLVGAGDYFLDLGAKNRTVTSTSYDISELDLAVGDYSIYVTANGSVKNDRVYLTSAASVEKLTAVRLAAPTFNEIAATASWDVVTNASKYRVSITGSDYRRTDDVNGLSYNFDAVLNTAGTYVVKVNSVGSVSANTIVLDSVTSDLTFIRLKAPTPIMKECVFSWNDVSGAFKYAFTIDNGGVMERTTDLTYDPTVLEVGVHSLKVQAIGGRSDRTFYLDSAVAEYEMTVSRLAKPTGLRLDGKTFRWDAVTNALTYSVNGDLNTSRSVDLSAKPNGHYDYSVVAKVHSVGQTLYLDSAAAEYTVQVTTLDAPVLSQSGKKVVWPSDEHASSYSVRLDSNAALTATEYDASNLSVGTHTVYVQALGSVSGNTIYLSSAVSSFTIVVDRIETPVLTQDDKIISWVNAANADGYQVSVDNGAWTGVTTPYDASAVLATTGIHTISVRAIGSESSGKMHIGSVPGTTTITVTKLTTPVFGVSGSTISWTQAQSAICKVSVNSGAYAAATSYDASALTSSDSISLSVKAYGWVEVGKVYLDSDAITYTVTRLAAPGGLGLDGKTFRWDAVANAAGYTVNGDVNSARMVDLSAKTNGNYNYSVVAKGAFVGSTLYLDSAAAAYSVCVTTLDAPVLSQSGKKVVWTADAHASAYFVSVDNNVPFTASEYDASELGVGAHTVYVQATGSVSGNTIYLTSSVSSFEIVVDRIGTPVLSQNGTNIKWDSNAGASAYQVSVNNGAWNNFSSPYDAASLLSTAGIYTISVKAIGSVSNGNIHLDSLPGTYAITVTKLTAPVFALNGSTISWSQANNAICKVSVNGGDQETAASYDASAVTAAAGITLSVQAFGWVETGKVYLNSDVITYTVTRLAIPVLSQHDTNIDWEAVANAFDHQVSVNDGAWKSANTYDASLLGEGEYLISVKAIGRISTDVIYLDSAVATYALTVSRLAAPVPQQDGKSIVWDSVSNASAYQVSVNDGAWSAATSYDASLLGEGNYVIAVKAIGQVVEHYIYLDSTVATYALTVSRLAAPVPQQDGKSIVWDSVSNASAYQVRVNDGEWNDATSPFDASVLTTPGIYVISIKALGVVTDYAIYLDSAEGSYEYTVEEVNE